MPRQTNWEHKSRYAIFLPCECELKLLMVTLCDSTQKLGSKSCSKRHMSFVLFMESTSYTEYMCAMSTAQEFSQVLLNHQDRMSE